jgi:hypothetical protein
MTAVIILLFIDVTPSISRVITPRIDAMVYVVLMVVRRLEV